MTDVHVRSLSDDEQRVFDDLMRATGAHVRDDFHTRLAAWRDEAAVLPLDFLAEMGARSPMATHDGQVFSVFRYEEAVQVLRDPATFSSEAVRNSSGKAFGKTIITEDAPEHTAIRRLSQGFFTRRELEGWRARLFEPVVHAYLDALRPRRRADLHREMLMPFPVTVLHRMMGLDDDPQRADWFHSLALKLFTIRGEDPAPGLAAADELFEFFLALIKQRRAEARAGRVRDDVASQLIALNDREHRVDDEELARFLRILLPGGADTTTNSTGNMFVTLLRHPEQLARVRADRSLVESCVDESIRFESSSPAVYRGTTRAVDLGGVRIPEGSILAVVVASANRDDRHFADPDVFDVGRPPGNHVGFGHGLHLCLGAHMARLEMSVALSVLLDELPGLRPDPDVEPPYVGGALHRHPGHLRVRWD